MIATSYLLPSFDAAQLVPRISRHLPVVPAGPTRVELAPGVHLEAPVPSAVCGFVFEPQDEIRRLGRLLLHLRTRLQPYEDDGRVRLQSRAPRSADVARVQGARQVVIFRRVIKVVTADVRDVVEDRLDVYQDRQEEVRGP